MKPALARDSCDTARQRLGRCEFPRAVRAGEYVLLDPILPEKGLAMLYAPRGAGKTSYLDHGLPNLATKEGQVAIEPLLAGISLVVIDNLSTLATAGRDNDAESWTPIQEWLLQLRRRT